MSDQIVNRIAQSGIIDLDPADFYPKSNILELDIKPWLFQGLLLKEKDFRTSVKNHDWSQYKNTFVAVTCSVDAIIPSWAYLLITTKLAAFTKKVVVGNKEQLEINLLLLICAWYFFPFNIGGQFWITAIIHTKISTILFLLNIIFLEVVWMK